MVAVLTNAHSMSFGAIDFLLTVSGVCLFISAWFFGLCAAPTPIGGIPKVVIVAITITILMFAYRSYIWPTPLVEISKDWTLLSIVIPSGANANVGTAKDQFKVEFVLYGNTDSTNLTLPTPCPKANKPPGMMFAHHVFNNNSYPISNIHAVFKVHFLGGKGRVQELGSAPFDVYIKSLSPSNAYTFYFANESSGPVMIDSPENIELDIPGGDAGITVPITRGNVIMGTFPISDIGKEKYPGAPPIDFPLEPTLRSWQSKTCED
jgi:hypothetical protein